MFTKPQSEHEWLAQLAGEWTVESECRMGPDQPLETSTGTVSARMLGGLWLVAEGTGHSPQDDSDWTTIMTLGYDPAQSTFVGTFIASMMTHLWPYRGQIEGNTLTLDSEGPRFDGKGLTKYRDSIEIVAAHHWIMRGEVLNDDGTWGPLMTGHHRRSSP